MSIQGHSGVKGRAQAGNPVTSRHAACLQARVLDSWPQPHSNAEPWVCQAQGWKEERPPLPVSLGSGRLTFESRPAPLVWPHVPGAQMAPEGLGVGEGTPSGHLEWNWGSKRSPGGRCLSCQLPLQARCSARLEAWPLLRAPPYSTVYLSKGPDTSDLCPESILPLVCPSQQPPPRPRSPPGPRGEG